MKVAVVGLGVEGKKAIKSLKSRVKEVYASDLDKNINLDEEVELDLGFHDEEKIFSADAVALSPGLWKVPLGERIKNSQLLLADKMDAHRSIFTIGITGTNGKTTTALMLKSIMEKSGMKVLIGGNAGGGFQGYTELFLEANENEYQVMIVEICDMTLEFCNHCFDFDLIVVTNMGDDHLDHHGSLTNFHHNLKNFLKDKKTFLNQLDENLAQIGAEIPQCNFYKHSSCKIPLFGRFNQINAGAAENVAKSLNIDEDIIKTSLENFHLPEGRIKSFHVQGSRLVVGKTDNVHALQEVLEEDSFPLMIIGTPRTHESWRFQILEVVNEFEPEILILFPGLEDSTSQAALKLKKLNFKGEIKILKDIDQLPETIRPYLAKKNIFIGGNGQQKIIRIQRMMAAMAKG